MNRQTIFYRGLRQLLQHLHHQESCRNQVHRNQCNDAAILASSTSHNICAPQEMRGNHHTLLLPLAASCASPDIVERGLQAWRQWRTALQRRPGGVPGLAIETGQHKAGRALRPVWQPREGDALQQPLLCCLRAGVADIRSGNGTLHPNMNRLLQLPIPTADMHRCTGRHTSTHLEVALTR